MEDVDDLDDSMLMIIIMDIGLGKKYVEEEWCTLFSITSPRILFI